LTSVKYDNKRIDDVCGSLRCPDSENETGLHEIKDNIVYKYEFEDPQGSTKDDKFVSNCLAKVSPALN